MTNDDAFGLDAAYALETPDDNRKLYAGWARTYESGFMADHSYVYHHHVAEIFDRHGGASGAETSVLDVGCGTGAVGTELGRLGPARPGSARLEVLDLCLWHCTRNTKLS